MLWKDFVYSDKVLVSKWVGKLDKSKLRDLGSDILSSERKGDSMTNKEMLISRID